MTPQLTRDQLLALLIIINSGIIGISISLLRMIADSESDDRESTPGGK